MAYGLQPYDPSSGHVPSPDVVARLQAQAALDKHARAEAALAARRARMADRWFTEEHDRAAIDGGIATVGLATPPKSWARSCTCHCLRSDPVRRRAMRPSRVDHSDQRAVEVDGEVTEVNEELDADPGLINNGPWDVG